MCAFSLLCSEITTYFVQTLSNFFLMKSLRTIHEFCMVNLPYHNEYVKKFSTQILSAVMVNRGDKGAPVFSLSISCQVWPKISHKPFDILQ